MQKTDCSHVRDGWALKVAAMGWVIQAQERCPAVYLFQEFSVPVVLGTGPAGQGCVK